MSRKSWLFLVVPLLMLVFAAGLGAVWTQFPSTSYPTVDNLLNGLLAFTIGSGAPGGASCTQGKDVYTDSNTGNHYWCSATNTWTQFNLVTSVFGQTGAVGNLSGPVTTSGSSATSIANGAITNVMIAASTIDLTAKVTGVLPLANGGSGLSTAPARYIEFIASGTNGSVGLPGWDLPASSAPVANTLAGSNTNQGTLDYASGVNDSAQIGMILPPGWTGNLDINLYWLVTSGGGSNAVTWQISTACAAVAASYDSSFNSAQTVTTNVGSNNNITQSTQTALTSTGCAAGSRLRIKIARSASDTSSATARMLSAVLTVRATPQS